MDIWSADKLALVIAFAIPGFITLKFYGLLSSSGTRNTSQQVLDAIAYSCINYAVLAFPIFSLEEADIRSSDPYTYFTLWAAFLLLVPIGTACAFLKLRETKFARGNLPHPIGKPWDYFFRQCKGCWVLVTLKDGRRIGGLYWTKSFSSDHPHAPELYLEDAWHLDADGWFESRKDATMGILVAESEISTVEFFDPNWSNQNEQEDAERGVSAESGERLPTSNAETSGRQGNGRLSANDQRSQANIPAA